MIIVVACLVAVLSVPLFGGKLSRLGSIRVRGVALVWASIIIQFAIIEIVGQSAPGWLTRALHIGSYVLSAAFLWLNRRLPGAWLIAIGGGMNAIAILANGGTMPASEWAWRTSGLAASSGGFENSDVVTNARLLPLGDVLAVPAGWPFANVFSVGDVILVIAVAYFVHRTCRAAGDQSPSTFTESTASTAA